MAGGRLRGQTGFLRQRLKLRAAQIAKHGVGLIDLNLRFGPSACTWPRVTKMSFQPSLSKSAIVGEYPAMGRVRRARPLLLVASVNPRLPRLRNKRKRLTVERHENDIRQAVVIDVPEIHAHSRDEFPVFGQSHAGVEGNFFETAAALVVKEEIVHLVVGDEEIHQAVQIVVRHPDAHSFSGMGADSRFRGNVAEGPVTVVEK